MIFNFEKFSKVVNIVYPGGSYSLSEVLGIFYYYFSAFERYMGKPHPPIRAEQIERIIEDMPFFEMEVTFGQFAYDQIVELQPYCQKVRH